MKLRLTILGILLLGAMGGYWVSRPDPKSRAFPGPLLSHASLQRLRISGGGSHALAIAPDGSLWSWGEAGSALGQGNVARPVKSPQRVGQDNDWAEISAGFSHSLAIKRDGSIWAWGSNPAGTLGDGTDQPRDTPTRIGTETNWWMAGPGIHHSAALKRDGTIWAWGGNGNGQLGSMAVTATGTNTSFLPVQVGTGTHWKALAVGSLANAAILRDGTLWTWGDGTRTPQVAPGQAANNFVPIQLGTSTNWTAVAAGYYHFIALQSDGSLWSWGRNGHMIGGIPAKDPSLPRRFGTETNWVTIVDGAYGNFIRKKDGSWWQAGGLHGRAKQVAIPGQWPVLGSGPLYSLAVAENGSLWHWGRILGEKKQPGWFKQGIGHLLNAMGQKNGFGQTITPTRDLPEQIFTLPAGQPAR